MMNWKGCGRSGRGLILRYPGTCLVELRKTMKPLSWDSRLPGRDLNPGLAENEAGLLPTRPLLSIDVMKLVITVETQTDR
jgi:hypothetical protein